MKFKDLKVLPTLPANPTNPSNRLIKKVISGGQSGIDILALQLAQKLGLPTGGTMSYNERGLPLAEYDGIDRSQFGFEFLPYAGNYADSYRARTRKNAADADGTIYFSNDGDSLGLAATQTGARLAGKPFINNPTPEQARDWAIANRIRSVNVGGNRGSKMIGTDLEPRASEVLNSLFNLEEPQPGQGSYTEVDGDLLSTDAPYVIQQANGLGVMGAGLARQIRNDISDDDFYNKYRRPVLSLGRQSLGQVFPIKSKSNPNRTYLNYVGQYDIANKIWTKDAAGKLVQEYDKSKVYTDTGALRTAFKTLHDMIPVGAKVAIPWHMGAGLANGNWDEILGMLKEALPDQHIIAYRNGAGGYAPAVLGTIAGATPGMADDAIALALTAGQILTHPKFGRGTVLDIGKDADKYVSIKFDSGDAKVFPKQWFIDKILKGGK